jgi:hypothetical protein
MNYKALDMVMTTQEFGSREFIIIEVIPQGYRAISTKTHQRYTINDQHIAQKVAEVTADHPLLQQTEYDVEEGRRYCSHQAREFPTEAAKWHYLASLKPGDFISLVHRKTLYSEAEFLSINFRKSVHPIRAKIKGLVYDFSLNSLVMQENIVDGNSL